MYHGYDIVSSAPFRVTRNSNLYLAEEEARSLLESVRAELHNRRKGDAVRMEIEADADPEIIERLRTVFELDSWQVFPVNGPVNLSRLFNVYEQVDRPDLKYRAVFAARIAAYREIERLCSRSCAVTTSCCTTRSIPTTRWCRSSSRRPKTITCFRSSRRSTAPTNIP